MIRKMTQAEKEVAQKSTLFCKGDNCVKKMDCLRYNPNKKVFRLASTNCIRLEFDLFKSMEVKDELD